MIFVMWWTRKVGSLIKVGLIRKMECIRKIGPSTETNTSVAMNRWELRSNEIEDINVRIDDETENMDTKLRGDN
jgi:hypothetical protein